MKNLVGEGNLQLLGEADLKGSTVNRSSANPALMKDNDLKRGLLLDAMTADLLRMQLKSDTEFHRVQIGRAAGRERV